jgi:hypothetical protein
MRQLGKWKHNESDNHLGDITRRSTYPDDSFNCLNAVLMSHKG